MDFRKSISDYYEKEIAVIESLDVNEINEAMNALLRHYDSDSNIYVFGNGGSSATASHMVCDFNKGTCSELEKRFNFICLNDNIPTLMAVANDIGFDSVFSYPLEKKLKPTDLVIAISGSGNSENVIKAVKYTKKIGAEVIAVTGYSGGELAKLGDYQLHASVDDMQITEDIHMSFDHMIMQIFWRFLATREKKTISL